MKKKRFISMFLAVVMLFSISVSAFAAVPEKVEEKASKIVDFKFTGPVDTNYNSLLRRGTSPPSSYWNLVNDYNGSASWDTNIYTNYYFSPNSSGELFVDFSLDYGYDPNPDRQFQIVLYKTTSSSSLTTYTRVVDEQYESGSVRFYNLDVNTFYYFKFSKTYDGVYADLDFTVYR
jgi:hypothetical protein